MSISLLYKCFEGGVEMVHKVQERRTMPHGRFACGGQGIELLFLRRRKNRRSTGRFRIEPGHGHSHQVSRIWDHRMDGKWDGRF